MAVDISEALTASVAQQSDVSEDMFELLTDLVLAENNAAASELLLRDKNLPLRLAEKLFERRGVTAAELVAFAAREDLPSETLTRLGSYRTPCNCSGTDRRYTGYACRSVRRVDGPYRNLGTVCVAQQRNRSCACTSRHHRGHARYAPAGPYTLVV